MKRKDVIDNFDIYKVKLITDVENYFTTTTGIAVKVKFIFQDFNTWLQQMKIIHGEDLFTNGKGYTINVQGLNIPKDNNTNIILINLSQLGITTWITKQWCLNKIVGVMLHELAHCVVKKHDDEFYELLEQLGCNVVSDDSYVHSNGEMYRTEKWPDILYIPTEQIKKER